MYHGHLRMMPALLVTKGATLAQAPHPICCTKVKEWTNIIGEIVTDGDRAGQLHLLLNGVRDMLQHGAKEVEMGLVDGVIDADIAWPEAQHGEAMEASQFPVHCIFGGVGECLAFVVAGEESVTTGGQVDRNASRPELLEEGGSIREHGGVLGDR